MTDFLGTSGDDVLDQTRLGLADHSGFIRGLGGNDKLSGYGIHLQGGAGNDVLTGLSNYTVVNYYDSPGSISVNMAEGRVFDGWGGIDTLVNIRIVHGSNFSDIFIGTSGPDDFWVGVGDKVQAGRGIDTITVWDDSKNWQIRKLDTEHTQVIQRSTGKTIELFACERLVFKDQTMSLVYDEKLVYQEALPSIPTKNSFLFTHSADINKDGLWDVIIGAGVAPPAQSLETLPQIFLQQKDGTFQKASISGSVEGFVHPREIATGDFNGDGITDIVVVGHGYDTTPFPGETPTIFWGTKDGGFVDGSEALPQTPAFTHSVAVADINGDNVDDLFLGNLGGQQQFPPKLLLGQRDGRFIDALLPDSIGVRALQANGVKPITAHLGDVTGDGRVDLVAGGDLAVFLYRGLSSALSPINGPFFSEKTTLPVGLFGANRTHTVDIKVMDLNQDGRQDLLLSQTTDGYQGGRAIQLLVQTPDGQWTDETQIRLHDWDSSGDWIAFINLIDLNQDGHLDLLANVTSNNYDAAFINDGAGHFYPASMANGVPQLSGAYLLPADAGKVLAVNVSNIGLLSINAIEVPSGRSGPLSSMPALAGAPGYNEQYYLRTNPDVAAAVLAGRIPSGLSEYLATGIEAGNRSYAPGTNVWGHDGIDTVRYSTKLESHQITRQLDDVWHLTGGSTGKAVDALNHIERIQFSDQTLALDIKGHAGLVAKTLGAVFGKESAANKSFVGIGLHFVDTLNFTYPSLMELAINARLGANPSHAQVVDLLYTNVVGQAPDAATRKTFTDLLDNGTFTVGSLGVLAADTELNQTNIKLTGLAQTGLEYLPFVG